MNTPNAFANLFHTAVLGLDDPDAANIPCRVLGSFASGAQLEFSRQYDAVIEMPLGFGMRDSYNGGDPVRLQLGPDEVYTVLFVERDRGRVGGQFLRAYLLRDFPAPS
ncbi:MAG: hypothetical protein RL179_366 [Planctomycetota bacterium]